MVYRHVALGGTFDHFHKGHEVLIKKAVEIGNYVTVGVTSDRFAGRESEPYEVRKTAVERNLGRLGCKGYSLVSLEDTFGPATTDESMDALVVSEETYGRAVELNRIRKEDGLEELEIIRIPMLHAEDGGSLSSSRIRQGEIDRKGRLR
jgi:pantetheine-phosphate adenylyltransferase